MATKYHEFGIVDGDGHVLEDDAALARYIPSKYKQYFSVRNARVFPALDHLHEGLMIRPPGSFQPAAVDRWLDFQERAGISAAVLYPTSGLACGRIVDHDYAIAACKAYNDWLYDNFTGKTSRLLGMGLIPMQDPDAAIAELHRCYEELHFTGVMLPSTGLPNHAGSSVYWPIYEEANRLGCPIAYHGGCHMGLGFDNLNLFAPIHAMGHPFGITIAFGSLLFNGVFDRFPNIRWGFLEGGLAWFLLALERFNGSHKAFIPADPRGEFLQLRKGENVAQYIIRLAREQRIFVGVEGDEHSIGYAVKTIGSKPFVFSSDFPHEVNDESVTGEIDELWEREDLTREDKVAILKTNAQVFYGLDKQ
jgi:predicted TIM-barrel fold metal-dependent hydrolase